MNDSGEWIGWLDPSDKWEYAKRVAGGDGIGNYPASREALGWCVEQLEQQRERHPEDFVSPETP